MNTKAHNAKKAKGLTKGRTLTTPELKLNRTRHTLHNDSRERHTMLTIDILRTHLSDDRKANEKSVIEYNQAKKYYHGEQLPPEVLNTILGRGQPPMHENLYKTIIDKIMGYKAQNIQEIKITGRQEQDKPLANLLQELLKNFTQSREYDKEVLKRDFELMLGLAIYEVWIQQQGEDMNITFHTLPTHSFLIDRYSTDINASDARRFHKLINMSGEEAKELFSDRVIIKNNHYADSRVEIVESWYKESGEWNRYVWQSNGNIIAYEKTPFLDKQHPFIISKYHIDFNNKWYGMFRDIKPLQDYINFTENKIANMMGSFKAFYESGAILDKNTFIQEASMDNAIVEVQDNALKEGRLQFVQHRENIAALTQKVEQKRNILKIISGLNEEALGIAHNRQSGIAIAQRRDAGLMGLSLYIKRSDEMDRLLFERVLSLIQHYYTKEQTFRIVDKKTGERYFTINTTPDNKIHIGKFDLIFQSTPKMQGREERFAHWSELLKTISSIRPDLITDLLPIMLKDTDSPIVADIEEVLAQKDQAMAQAAQAQQQAQEIEITKAQSSIAKDQAAAEKLNAQAKLLHSTTAQINQQNVFETLANAQSGDNAQNTRAKQVMQKMHISPSDIR